ncbi:diguanylate cyclase domain-containing protein [Limnospira fusiformis]|uniref:diguanylate cyclase domain-containing protein n=1 Tax=Limnospira fusiformis TaxID=54297 RepID=UPI00296EF7F3
MFQTTWDGHYINVNPALAKIYGYDSPQALMTQLTDISHQLYVDPGRRAEFISQLQESDSITNFESQVYRADHQIIWISEKARAVRDGLGQLLYYEGMVEDITERKQAEENLQQQAERQRLMLVITQRIRRSLKLDKILQTTVSQVREFLNTDRVVIYRFHDDGNGVMVFESVAPGWKSVVGTIVTEDCWTPHYLAGFSQGQVQAMADLSTQDFSQCDIRLLSEFQVQANLVVPILTRRRSDTSAELGFVASEPYNRLWGLLMVQHCSGPRQWESTAVDFIKQLAVQLGIAIQQAELYQQLERLATLDGLTQVPNRRQFDTYLITEWRRCIREFTPISLILCDVDFFKHYNDTYGHQEGDRCLQEVAQALTRSIRRPGDLVARYGGEEFAIILPNTDAEGMCNVAGTIREQILQLQRIHETSPISEYISVSMGGVSVLPNSNMQLEHLISMADTALYQAKAQGRDRFVMHTMS